MNMILSRDDLLFWIKEDMNRAYEDAERRLTAEGYDVSDGLFTEVTIRAVTQSGEKISKFKKVGDASCFRAWKERE